MLKKLFAISVVAVSLLFLSSCSENNSPIQSNFSKDNSISLSLALPDCESISKGVVIISKSGLDTITKVLTIEKDRVYGTIENIPSAQDLHIVINIYDKNMNVVYYGDTYADVISSKVTDVVINLKNAKGTINVTGIFTNDTIIHNISGTWNISQSNNHSGTIEVTQAGASITGTSKWSTHSNGPITGTIKGDSINFQITYPTGDGIGFYSGLIKNNGTFMTGLTTSTRIGDTAVWESKKVAILAQQ